MNEAKGGGIASLVFLAAGFGCASAGPEVSVEDKARLEEVLKALSRTVEQLDRSIAKLEVRELSEPGVCPDCSSPPETPSASPGPAPPKPPVPPKTPRRKWSFVPDTKLFVCPGMRVSNRPRTEPPSLRILDYRPFVRVAGKVDVAVAPLNGACLSSGAGPRGGRNHKGLDYWAKPAPLIYAAAPGKIVEAEFYKAYGNMVVIDHGDGVFTRYAHLEGFETGVAVGAEVLFGRPLGRMGSSSSIKTMAIHLHYEILVGEYGPKKAFGLDWQRPFRLLVKTSR